MFPLAITHFVLDVSATCVYNTVLDRLMVRLAGWRGRGHGHFRLVGAPRQMRIRVFGRRVSQFNSFIRYYVQIVITKFNMQFLEARSILYNQSVYP
jgi:hypothetical protein